MIRKNSGPRNGRPPLPAGARWITGAFCTAFIAVLSPGPGHAQFTQDPSQDKTQGQPGSATDANISGAWKAVILKNNLPQPVTMEITGLNPGEPGMKMTYAKPQSCNFLADYGGATPDGHVFYVQRTNCWGKITTDDYIVIRADGADRLSFAINRKGQVVESGLLEGQAR